MIGWIKLDAGFPEHPKVPGISDVAFRLHVSAMCWCNRHLTDGTVPVSVLKTLVPSYDGPIEEVALSLVNAGLWEIEEPAERVTFFKIHDYLDYQRSRETVLKIRAGNKQRKQVSRLGHGHVTLVSQKCPPAKNKNKNKSKNKNQNRELEPSSQAKTNGSGSSHEERLTKENTQTIAQSESETDSSAPDSEFVTWLKSNYPKITQPRRFETNCRAAYPGIRLLAEALKAKAWEEADPRNRKTRHAAFLNNWFSRAQERASRGNGNGNGSRHSVIQPAALRSAFTDDDTEWPPFEEINRG